MATLPDGTERDYYLKVYLRHPGDFGFCSISSVTRTEEEEKALCNRVITEIERHVNDIGSISIAHEDR